MFWHAYNTLLFWRPMSQGPRCSNTSSCSRVRGAAFAEYYQWARVAGTDQTFSSVFWSCGLWNESCKFSRACETLFIITGQGSACTGARTHTPPGSGWDIQPHLVLTVMVRYTCGVWFEVSFYGRILASKARAESVIIWKVLNILSAFRL